MFAHRSRSVRRLIPTLSLGLGLAAGLRAAEQISVRYSHSADNPLVRGAVAAGDVSVNAEFIEWRSSLTFAEPTRFHYGLGWSGYHFSRSAVMAAPARLQKIFADLGASHRLNSRWLLIASVQPGLYGDLEGGSHDAFNAPGLAFATFTQSRALAWSFGLRVDPFADKPVLPIVGVNWRFAPDWEFNLGFPRAGFSYAPSDAVKLGLGATVQGGSFHIAEDPRPVWVTDGPRLDDTQLDYREIRVGLSVDYRLGTNLGVTVEAGVITDQKLDYYDRGYTLNGDAAAFFLVGLSGRF